MARVWAEWSFDDDGMGVTLYRDEGGPGVTVVDEAWFTWSEVITEERSTVTLSEEA